MSSPLTRRQLLVGTGGAAALAVLSACERGPSTVSATSDAVRRAEAARRSADGRTVTAALNPRPVTFDLGGPRVRSWGYAEELPGPLLRARAGDVLSVDLRNGLPVDTSVHWHGIALRADMDGVPGASQPQAVRSGGSFHYEFTVPDPGTYWYHPHVGTQLDRGLYGVLLVDDPHDAGDYDVEWTVVLDDWLDGTGRDPDGVLAALVEAGGGQGAGGTDHGMPGMDHGSMPGMGGMGEGMTSGLLGGAGDVDYPHYLANGRIAAAPRTFNAKPRQRVRLRLVNAAADTAFRVALGGHRLTVTHTDGFPVDHVTGDALLIGMGERYDVVVTLGDGVFPLVAVPEGKAGQALALVRTGSGPAPRADVRPDQLTGRLLTVDDLTSASSVALPTRRPDRTHTLALGGTMAPYTWTINGRTFDHAKGLPVEQGERVVLRFVNHSMMFHPMHLHGHTFQVRPGARGPRKDTVIVKPMQSIDVAIDATNPGQWMLHCHNAYHAERGMMTTLSYVT